MGEGIKIERDLQVDYRIQADEPIKSEASDDALIKYKQKSGQ